MRGGRGSKVGGGNHGSGSRNRYEPVCDARAAPGFSAG
ncbi:hypothetical protein PATSB16_02730 [Pandoraea thiooxydans]|nr:hypothetical protein PATSB16_02730 [Pandoraea thiooxydans]